MRVKDFTSRYDFDHDDFVQFLKDSNLFYNTGLGGYTIPDANAAEYRKRYMDYCEKRKKRIISERQRCLLTTASYLDQYVIKEYYGLVTGHAFFNTGYIGQEATQFFGTGGNARAADLTHAQNSYIRAEESALQNMKNQALSLGANAVLSIQQSTTNASGVVCITVRGTAAVVEKGTAPKAQPYAEKKDSASISALAEMRPRDERHATNPYVDQDLCIGCEKCADICPELFQMRNGKAVALADMTVETWKKGNEAIDNCPVGAILEI